MKSNINSKLYKQDIVQHDTTTKHSTSRFNNTIMYTTSTQLYSGEKYLGNWGNYNETLR